MRYPDFDGTQLCAEVGLDLFFPTSTDTSDYMKAKTICNRCEWQWECAEWAIHHDNGHGMFGGLNPVERRQIRAQRGIKNEPW
jgi:WhiB family redox-sensing transcriptional regulator